VEAKRAAIERKDMLFLYKIINTLTIVQLDFFKIRENKSRNRLPRITLKDNTVRMNLFHIPNFSFGQQKRDPMSCGQFNQATHELLPADMNQPTWSLLLPKGC